MSILAATLNSSCKDKKSTAESKLSKSSDSASPTATSPFRQSRGNAEFPPKISEATRALFGPLTQTPVTDRVSILPLQNGSVILLIFDALNARHLSVYGYKRNTSPFIKDIARKGLILTNHVSNSTWTRPSFTTIVTGVSKDVHGVEAAGG